MWRTSSGYNFVHVSTFDIRLEKKCSFTAFHILQTWKLQIHIIPKYDIKSIQTWTIYPVNLNISDQSKDDIHLSQNVSFWLQPVSVRS